MPTVTIKQKKILSLNISFDKDFVGGDVIAQSTVKLTPIIPPSDNTSVYLVIEFGCTCDAMTNDFKLKAELTIPFYLNKKSDIQKTDFYKCVELTKDHLQNIINAIFAGQNPLIVPPVEFDDLEDKLDEHIQSL